MPELPEVESVRRQLAPALTGRRLQRVEVSAQSRFLRVEDAEGLVVADLRRRGKYLLAGLTTSLGRQEPKQELVMHLGMTGSFRIRGRDGWTPDPYVRASFHLANELSASPTGHTCQVIDFRDVRRFGRLAVVPAGDYDEIATLAHLGPEPLLDEFDPDLFARALSATRMPVKPFLLTQRPVAGVGNIYADEALWLARINPHSRRVGKGRARSLWRAIREVLTAAIEREGTTFRDYQMVNGQSGRNADYLVAYGRVGMPCSRCGETMRKVTLAGRGTTYCPACQAR